MAVTVWKRAHGQVTPAATKDSIYTCPANKTADVIWLNVTNTHTGNVVINGDIYYDGTTARQIFEDITLETSGPAATYTHDGTIFLEETDEIRIECNTDAVADVCMSIIERS